ncbi:hypothetical protein ACQPW3_16170 [Actinosynnema sp. CA-248983]
MASAWPTGRSVRSSAAQPRSTTSRAARARTGSSRPCRAAVSHRLAAVSVAASTPSTTDRSLNSAAISTTGGSHCPSGGVSR